MAVAPTLPWLVAVRNGDVEALVGSDVGTDCHMSPFQM